VIERELPGAGKLTPDRFVTDDKIYCVYVAPDEDIIFEHARCGGFPADKVSRVTSVIDPTTGD
jgi:hypothetical protein